MGSSIPVSPKNRRVKSRPEISRDSSRSPVNVEDDKGPTLSKHTSQPIQPVVRKRDISRDNSDVARRKAVDRRSPMSPAVGSSFGPIPRVLAPDPNEATEE